MADFSLYQNNKVFTQGSYKNVNNTFNMHDFVMCFPLYRSSAFMIGITPFSSVGYTTSQQITDSQVIGNTGNVTYASAGEGRV